MKTLLFRYPLLTAAALALAFALPAHADEAVGHIAFSDPSKPGTLRIRVWQGAITVHGSDAKDITVKTDSTTPPESETRDDGMRVLSASSSYRLSEKNNVVALAYGGEGLGGTPADFDITVPKTTSVIVVNSIRGDFTCRGISGDMDVRTIHGDVKADDVSGSVCIESMNGEITVNMASLSASKLLSLTSMNGKILIRVPSDAKASVRFRTHHGVILTNFDDKALVTRTEISQYQRHVHKSDSDDESETPAAPSAPAAPGAPAAPAAPAADEAPMAESDGDWHAEVRDSVREAAEAMHEAAYAVHEGLAEVSDLPFPPLPPMTGGKTVSGALNGGGVEIQVATLNGDIVLKKAD
jgi:Putative adhesin